MARAKKKIRKASDAATDRFHAESRAHVAQLAAEGRGRAALAEGAKLLGIDLSKPVEFRLVSVGGMKLSCVGSPACPPHSGTKKPAAKR